MAHVLPSENVCVSPTVARLIFDLASILGQSPLDGWREEFEDLHRTLTAIHAIIEDAEQKQLNNQRVKDWLRKLRELACDAEDVLDSLMTEVRTERRDQEGNLEARSDVIPPCSTRLKSIGHVMRDLLHRLLDIDNDKEQLQLEKGGKHWIRREIDTSRLEDAQYVIGREEDKSNIIKLLLSNDSGGISVIPIIGMGGLGKTTLSHLVFNDREVGERFNSRMWVCVSDDFDQRRILREMINYHSKMTIDPNLSVPILESRLLEFLEGKPFLLVLDDVWPETCQDWEKLKKVLDKGGKGSKVLISSRSEKVSEMMGSQKPYNLDYLPEDKCLSLFTKIAFDSSGCFSEERKEKEQLGKMIVQKCKGLPLAVKAMAGLLRNMEDVKHWEDILTSEIWKIEEDNQDEIGNVRVLPALQFSFYHLPSTLKECFAFCSIFPKSYIFEKQDLVKLWMAQAFLQPRDVDTTPQEVGSQYFDELLMRSFFQSSDMHGKAMYRMHDLIHDMAMSVSMPYCFLVKGTESSESSKSSPRHVSLLSKDVREALSEVIDNSKKLRTLLFPTRFLKNYGPALDEVFRSLKWVRALDLSCSQLKQLPDGIVELKLLRYLDLSETEIRELPSALCRLYNLETLKLLGCRDLYELPEDFADLVNLCHLELDEMFWFKVTKLPPRMGNLTKLHNLHKFIVSEDTGHGLGELNRLTRLDGTLCLVKLENARDAAGANLKEKTNVREVVFEWSSNFDGPEDEQVDHTRILEDLEPHTDINALQVSGYKGSALPRWLIDGVFGKLVTIRLAHCVNCKTLSFGDMPQLRELKLKGMLELEEWSDEWYSLTRLNISNCPKLQKMPKLIFGLWAMKIKMCDRLEVLPITPGLRFLILDSNSSLKDWQEGVLLIRRQINQQEGQGDVQPQWSFSDILEMKIIRCPELEGLPEIFTPQKLEIHNCGLITMLPRQDFSQHLQHLALVGCDDGTLVRTIPSAASLYSLVIASIANLSALPEWPQLPGLKYLYIHDCQHLESMSSENGGSLQVLKFLKLLSVRNCPMLITLAVGGLPQKIECLRVSSCPNLESLGPMGTLTSLTELKDVYILDCPELQSLPEDGFPVSLQHLYIESCPILRARCSEENGGGPDWPKIKDIPDLEMPSPCSLMVEETSPSGNVTGHGTIGNDPESDQDLVFCSCLSHLQFLIFRLCRIN